MINFRPIVISEFHCEPWRGARGPSRDLYTESGQTLQGSFSSVSTPPIARVGAFFSILRDLQDFQSFAPLRIQNFSKTCWIFPAFLPFFCKNLVKICSISTKFHQNFPRISQNLRECAPRTRPGEFPEFSPNFPRIFPDLHQFRRKAQVSSMR